MTTIMEHTAGKKEILFPDLADEVEEAAAEAVWQANVDKNLEMFIQLAEEACRETRDGKTTPLIDFLSE